MSEPKKVYSLEEIIIKLKSYQKICNQAIELSRTQDIQGAINWGDLKCYDVRYFIGIDGDELFQFLIDEADPVNEEFKEFICQQILSNIPDMTYIEIITEW